MQVEYDVEMAGHGTVQPHDLEILVRVFDIQPDYDFTFRSGATTTQREITPIIVI
jgi:hypothetical protein